MLISNTLHNNYQKIERPSNNTYSSTLDSIPKNSIKTIKHDSNISTDIQHSSSHMLELILAGWFQKKLEAESINLQESLGKIDVNQKEGMKQTLENSHSIQKGSSTEVVKMIDLKSYMKNIESSSNGENADEGINIKA